MTRDSSYDVLFEPVQIGPVTAKNRFYQVPHCNGMGFNSPQSHAKMREAKAEGGWAVICTEECMIHPSSDYSPEPQARLWDGYDVKCLGLMVDVVHRHGALAGVQLAHNGVGVQNLYTRIPPIGPSDQVAVLGQPSHTRGMSKNDIREFRRWHRNAALRAKSADADIVYVYAGHDTTLLKHFLCIRHNQRTDEYGGSLENRVRLLREVLEETKDAVGDRCAVAIRFAVEELLGPEGITSEGEGREIIEMLAELPDLWDVNLSDWDNDSQTSRFSEEGFQEQYVKFVKSVTSKPVVGVGRFTSPDAMVSQINRGVLDMIGAARPSIADPFLPQKIEQGRIDEIRECIGCNTCVSGQLSFTPMRCTQNPSVGEEWRRNWHLYPQKDLTTAFLSLEPGQPASKRRGRWANADTRLRSPKRKPSQVGASPSSPACRDWPPGPGYATGVLDASSKWKMCKFISTTGLAPTKYSSLIIVR